MIEELAYPFAEIPPDGEAVEVADGIFWFSTPVPFAGLRQVNLWLLRDGGGWTMVDCGFGYAAARTAIETAWDKVLAGRPVTRLIVTHFHPDHAGNSGSICRRWGLQPLLTQGEWFAANLAFRDRAEDMLDRRIAFFRAHGLDEARLALFATGRMLYADVVTLPAAFTRIREGDALAIGDDTWTVLVGEGHSPEHASLYCAARKIMISGDQVLPTITTNISVWHTEPEADPLGLFLATGRRFAQALDPATLVLPSHRKPFRNVHARLKALEHHHAERLDLVLQAGEREITTADLVPILFQRALDGHQMGFAMGEALAHLNHLVAQGSMTRRRDDAGVWRYRRS